MTSLRNEFKSWLDEADLAEGIRLFTNADTIATDADEIDPEERIEVEPKLGGGFLAHFYGIALNINAESYEASEHGLTVRIPRELVKLKELLMVAVASEKLQERPLFLQALNELILYIYKIEEKRGLLVQARKLERLPGWAVDLAVTHLAEINNVPGWVDEVINGRAQPLTLFPATPFDRFVGDQGVIKKLSKLLEEGKNKKADRTLLLLEQGYGLLRNIASRNISADQFFLLQSDRSYVLNPIISEVEQITRSLDLLVKKVLERISVANRVNKIAERVEFYQAIHSLLDYQQTVRVNYAAARTRTEENLRTKQTSVIIREEIVKQPTSPQKVADVKMTTPIKMTHSSSEALLTNDEVKVLMSSIEDFMDESGLENRKKILVLLSKLRQALEKQEPSIERNAYIHKELMKTYLLEGYLVEREKGLFGKVSLGLVISSLEKAMNQFYEKTRHKLFIGYVKEKKKSTTKSESRQIIASVNQQAEVEEIVSGAFERAMAEGIGDQQKQIFVNAEKMVIAIEDDKQTSSLYWNKLVKDKFGPGCDFEIALKDGSKDYDKRRKEKKIAEVFEKGTENLKSRVIKHYYPVMLVNLLNKNPEQSLPRMSMFAETFNLQKIHSLVKQLKAITGTENQVMGEVYRTVMSTYIDVYCAERSKIDTKTVKGPTLKYLEEILDQFFKKTQLELFVNQSKSERHDRILSSIQNQTISTEKVQTLTYLVKNIFDRVMLCVVNAKSNAAANKYEDLYVNSFKVLERMGKDAKIEWNRQAQQYLGSIEAEDVLIPDLLLDHKMEENALRASFRTNCCEETNPWLVLAAKKYLSSIDQKSSPDASPRRKTYGPMYVPKEKVEEKKRESIVSIPMNGKKHD